MREDNAQATCPAQRDIEDAALFRMRIRIRRGKHKSEKWIIGDLGRKPILSSSRAQDYDVISLCTLCCVNRHPLEAQRSVGLLYFVSIRRKRAPITPEHEHGRAAGHARAFGTRRTPSVI
jgi:hypothetical protein